MQWLFAVSGDAVGKNLRQRRAHILPSLNNGANRADELGRCSFLVQVTRRAGAQKVHCVLIFAVSGEHEHRQLRLDMTQQPQRVDAVLVGHRDVEQYDVEVGGPYGRYRLGPARRLRCGFHVDLVGNELTQSGPDDGVIVRDQDSDHLGLSNPASRAIFAHREAMRAPSAWYAVSRLYSVFRLTPSISAARRLLPRQWSSVAKIAWRSISASDVPTGTSTQSASTDALPRRPAYDS